MYYTKEDFWYVQLVNAFHLAYYVPLNHIEDTPISKYVKEFKNNNPKFVSAWSEWACQEIKAAHLKFECIVRALGSKEHSSDGTNPLDELGRKLANAISTKYTPQLLAKTRLTPPMHKLRTKLEREDAVRDSYYVTDDSLDLTNKKVLIIDDISTSKTTIAEILRALRSKYEFTEYYFFFLARTKYNRNSNKDINLDIFK